MKAEQNAYYEVGDFLKESGWKIAMEVSYPNCDYYHWAPANDKTEDVYLFEGSHRNSNGRSLQVIWATSYEDALDLHDKENGIPCLSVKSFEDFQAIIRSLL